MSRVKFYTRRIEDNGMVIRSYIAVNDNVSVPGQMACGRVDEIQHDGNISYRFELTTSRVIIPNDWNQVPSPDAYNQAYARAAAFFSNRLSDTK